MIIRTRHAGMGQIPFQTIPIVPADKLTWTPPKAAAADSSAPVPFETSSGTTCWWDPVSQSVLSGDPECAVGAGGGSTLPDWVMPVGLAALVFFVVMGIARR